MKTWKRALALVLALVMALSLVALPSFAEGEDESTGDTGMPYINGQGGTVEQNGLVMSKTIKEGENGQFLLTLEAYATGSTTTTTSTKPVDIVLVLDVSGSMKDSISDKYDHYETIPSTPTAPITTKTTTVSISRRTTAMESITVGVGSLTTLLAGTQRTTSIWGSARANPACP